MEYYDAFKMKYFLIACLSIFVLWISTLIYVSIFPAYESIVQIPGSNAVVRFQAWGYFVNPQPYTLRVETPHGTLSKKLWTNWGPADDLALYKTPEGWVVGIGGGGESVIVDPTGASNPRIISGDEQKRTNDATWEFLGYAQGGGFTLPSKRKECINLLGAGYSSYRREHQFLNHCPSGAP